MDALLIIKCVLVGVFWAIAYYTFLGFLLMHFPIPNLLRIKNSLSSWAANRIRRNPKRGERFWRRVGYLTRFTAIVLVAATLAFYYISLKETLPKLLKLPPDMFWYYYAIAGGSAIPVFIFLGWFFVRHQSNTPILLD